VELGSREMRSKGEEHPSQTNLRKDELGKPHPVEIRFLLERPFLYFIAFEFLRGENWQ